MATKAQAFLLENIFESTDWQAIPKPQPGSYAIFNASNAIGCHIGQSDEYSWFDIFGVSLCNAANQLIEQGKLKPTSEYHQSQYPNKRDSMRVAYKQVL